MPTNTLSRFGRLSLLTACLSPISLFADTIHDWPTIQDLDISQFTQDFIDVFGHQPEHLDALTQGLQICSINPDRLAKLSNVNSNAMSYLYGQDSRADIDLTIKELILASSEKGCEALKTTPLEPIPRTKSTQFQVSADFKHDYFIFADYESKGTITSKVDGASYTSDIESDQQTAMFYAFNQAPLVEGYQNALYTLMTVNTADISITSHYLQITPNTLSDVPYDKLILSRNYLEEGANNTFLTYQTNAKGQGVVESFGTHTFTRTLDGKLSGLFIYDNYLYRPGSNQTPLSLACYQDDKRLNVFERVGSTRCKKASVNQIGRPNIYVDDIYQRELSSAQKARWNETKHRLITLDKPTFVLNPSQSSPSKQAIAKVKVQPNTVNDKDFKAKQTKAKCALTNPNWVYLGDQCQNGFAEGEGKAIDRQGLTFVGTFKAGNRIAGDIMQEKDMIFSGEFKQDKPDGSAICLYEGEYEECRFFRGKRIDTLYKIRKENAKNLAQMAELQAQQEANLYANDPYQDQAGQSNVMIEALKEQGAKKAASFIFDKLF